MIVLQTFDLILTQLCLNSFLTPVFILIWLSSWSCLNHTCVHLKTDIAYLLYLCSLLLLLTVCSPLCVAQMLASSYATLYVLWLQTAEERNLETPCATTKAIPRVTVPPMKLYVRHRISDTQIWDNEISDTVWDSLFRAKHTNASIHCSCFELSLRGVSPQMHRVAHIPHQQCGEQHANG